MLGKKYLDWVELLPEFGGGIIATLQQVRKHQRKDSERTYERSRPPENCTIEILYFRLTEVFHLEQSKQLLNNLLRLFPRLEDESLLGDKPFQDAFRDQAGRIGGTAYWNLGNIVRKRDGRVFGRQVQEMEELPQEVDYIRVWLYKILPSVFVVTLDVHLTDEVTQHLNRLQNRRYLPEIQFQKLIPRGPLGGGFSESRAEAVMQRNILSWLKQLRGKVEKCVKPYLSGYFMQWSSDKFARLPAIEVYALKGGPIDNSIIDWMRDNDVRWWWNSFGFSSYGYDSYSDGKVLFIPKETQFKSSDQLANRLVVRWEPYIEAISTKGFIDEKGAVMHYTENTLVALLPCITLLEILACLQRDFEQLRQKVFGRMRMTLLPTFRLGTHFRLNNVILRTSMSLDRISTEFEQAKELFIHQMGEVSMLESVEIVGNNEPRKLTTTLIDSIDFKVKLLNTHVTFVKDWFSQYLNLRNTEAIYALAFIAGFAAVISTVLAWLALTS